MTHTSYHYYILVTNTILTKVQYNDEKDISSNELSDSSNIKASINDKVNATATSSDDSSNDSSKSKIISDNSEVILPSTSKNTKVSISDLFHQLTQEAHYNKELTEELRKTYQDLESMRIITIQPTDIKDAPNKLVGQTLVDLCMSNEYTGGYLNHLIFMLGYSAQYSNDINNTLIHTKSHGDYMMKLYSNLSKAKYLGKSAD